MKLISCKNLTIEYDGHIAANNISFDLEKADYLCIVGENGSGKTTLMKGILGLIKPISGNIIFDRAKKIEIGYLPQQTMVQKDFPANVFEVVLSGCLNRCGLFPFYSQAEKNRANYNINRLEINELKKKSYRDLSGGQQQRVLLARALCAAENLLLLDEPVTGLDPMMASEMYSIINKLNQNQGITVIMVSHDINSAVKYSNKILHMETESVFFGSTEEYLTTDICHKMMGGVKNA